MKKYLLAVFMIALMSIGAACSDNQSKAQPEKQEPSTTPVPPMLPALLVGTDDRYSTIYWVDTRACFENPAPCEASSVTLPVEIELMITVFTGLSSDSEKLYLYTVPADFNQGDLEYYAIDLQAGTAEAVTSEEAPDFPDIYSPTGTKKVAQQMDASFQNSLNINDTFVIPTSGVIASYVNVSWSPDEALIGTTIIRDAPDSTSSSENYSITLKAGAPFECATNPMLASCAGYVIIGPAVDAPPTGNSVGLIDVVNGGITEIASPEPGGSLRFLGWLDSGTVLVGDAEQDVRIPLHGIRAVDLQGNELPGALPDYLTVESYVGLNYGIAAVRANDQLTLYRLSDGVSVVVPNFPADSPIIDWYIIRQAGQ